ncbi:MAG TPA: YiiX family permuted papain-like enzyme [Candidatus Krumholzibacteria bacterium]|nr:YiiX family permuted papain-like enzyme [Candidatus Krumholzibacteria bacterium]
MSAGKKRSLQALLLLALQTTTLRADELHSWDIIFQTSRSSQSVAIQKATHSVYSHMGLILRRGASIEVLEAADKVRRTPLSQWIADGVEGRYVVMRLRDAESQLSADAVMRLQTAAESFLGRPYDSYFEWSDTSVYCSELVWKVYALGAGIHLGKPVKLREFDLSDPLVQAKLRERFADRIPLEEPVLSPATILCSGELVLVASTPMSAELRDVLFQRGSAELDQEACTQLTAMAGALLRDPNAALRLEGHCSESRDPKSQRALAEKRAQTAKDFLVCLGVEAGRLETSRSSGQGNAGDRVTFVLQ